MKIYQFKFKGLWMGGWMVLIAKNEEEALKMAQFEIEKNKDNGEKLTLISIDNIDKPKIIFYDNGDY